LENEEVSLEVV